MRALMLLSCLVAGCDSATDGETDTDGETPELAGAVFRLQFGSLEIEGADPAAADLIRVAARPNILMQAFEADETTVSWRLAFGTDVEPLEQDICSRTNDLAPGTLSGTEFAVPPSDTPFPSDPPWTLYSMEVTGTLSADLESASDITLSGTVDAREVEGLVTAVDGADALCDALGDFGLACGGCPDGQAFCVSVTATGLSARRVEGVTVEPIATTACK